MQEKGKRRMTPHLISIYALVLMFVIATIWPINMGVLAFVGAFLVGTLLAAQTTKDIIAGFPGGLFLTLVGITWLFALAQNNGTIDWLVRLAVRSVGGRIADDLCRQLLCQRGGGGDPVHGPGRAAVDDRAVRRRGSRARPAYRNRPGSHRSPDLWRQRGRGAEPPHR